MIYRAGPLDAIISSQAAAAQETINFIQQVGFVNGTALTVDFKYTGVNATTGLRVNQTISVPFLVLVPIPFIRVSLTHDHASRQRDCGAWG